MAIEIKMESFKNNVYVTSDSQTLYGNKEISLNCNKNT